MPVTETRSRYNDITSGVSAVKVPVIKRMFDVIKKNSIMTIGQRVDPISKLVIGPE